MDRIGRLNAALAALDNAMKHLESSEVVLAYKAIKRAIEDIAEVRKDER